MKIHLLLGCSILLLASCVPTCANNHTVDNDGQCEEGVFLPVWKPQRYINTGDRIARGLVYLVAMIYIFVGISMISAKLIAALEIILGRADSVTSFTLTAIASSAFEIIFLVVKPVSSAAAEIGFGVIVGSSAVNLLVIPAICILVIPNGTIKQIWNYPVFIISALWFVFSLIWVRLVLMVISPGVVETWEAVLTIVFFLAYVLTAYLADKIFEWSIRKRRMPRENVEMKLDAGSETGDVTVVPVVARSKAYYRVCATEKLTGPLLDDISWINQIRNAVTITDEEGKSTRGCCKHVLPMFWKVILACIPPAGFLEGYPTFLICIVSITFLTTLMADLASHLCCTVGLKDMATSVIFLALALRAPDCLACKIAAVREDNADISLTSVLAANNAMIFLGIGTSWTIATLYYGFLKDLTDCGYHIHCGTFSVDPGSLGNSVFVLCACAIVVIIMFLIRRTSGFGGGELGGPVVLKYSTSILFFTLWLLFVFLIMLESYGIIKEF